MKNKLLLVVVVLALVAGVCHAEAGVGVSVSYPLAIALVYDMDFDSEMLFAGVAFRWKPSLLLIDVGTSAMLGGGLMYGFLDLGLCFDLAFLRFGLAGGVDFVRFSDSYWGDYTAGGLNAKLNLDIKLGKLTVGASASIPIDVLLEALGGDGVENEFRLVAAQPSVNVMYWFGRDSRSRLR